MKNKQPAIRFKGFTEDWKQRKLGEIFKYERPDNYIIESDKYSDIYSTPVLTANKSFILGYTNETKTYNNPSIIFDDFTLDFKYVDFPYMVKSSALKILTSRDENKYNLKFLFEVLNSIRIEIMGHARHYITVVQPTEVFIPDIKEQIKIGGLYNQLNTLINLYQSKCDKLVNIKKSLLEKMFPKSDSNVPEIRFKGFTEDWEQNRLKELGKQTFGGGTPQTSVKKYWNGSIPWIQSSDLIDGKLFNVVLNKRISKEGLNNSATKLVPKNSIAIVTRVGVGKLAFMPFQYTTSQDFLSLSQLKTNPWFTVYACYKKIQAESSAVQGTSIKGITKEELLEKIIYVPYNEEQKKIGKFFKQIDNLINLYKRKIEKLQNIKKFCLDKMFV